MVMVFFTEKLIRVLADCCNVDVINGAFGRLRVGLSSRLEMRKAWVFNSASSAEAVASLVGRRSLIFGHETYRRRVLCPIQIGKASQYSSGTNARISRSRSTISRTATLCASPRQPRATFAQSSGDNSKPTTRSKNRRACWA